MNFIKCQYCEFFGLNYEIPDGPYGICSFIDGRVDAGDRCRKVAVEKIKSERKQSLRFYERYENQD